jgi:hypothetical protein
MEQQWSFEFQLHTHLPFSSWYHAHFPIFCMEDELMPELK